MTADIRPKLVEGTVVNVDEGQVITVTSQLTGKVYVFNDVARRILELADGALTTEEIADKIAGEFPGGDKDQVARDVGEFVNACLEAQLVTGA